MDPGAAVAWARGTVDRVPAFPPATNRRRDGFLQWYFRSPVTGDVVLYQPPNTAIRIAGGLLATSRVLRAVRVTEAGSPLDVALERAGTAVLVWWGVDELLRGATPYRRTIGGLSLATTLLRAVRAERRRSSPARPAA